MADGISSFIEKCKSAIAPLVMRPHGRQVAALCTRAGGNGKEVLLITSLGTGRWIIPKGWPMKGKDFPQTALEEAWEEAGVRVGLISDQKIGSYTYRKVLDNGATMPCEVDVYAVSVEQLEAAFPDCDKRIRKWVPLDEAVTLVQEPELKNLIRAA